MVPDNLLGHTVIATNDRGAQFRGRVTHFDLWGQAVVEVEAVDLGYEWGFEEIVHTEEMSFPVAQVERAEE